MRLAGRAGLTLVEVMAAMAILTIAMAAVFSTFEFQQKSYTTQSRVAELQQNLRLAEAYLDRDIRMAGYGIPSGGAPAGVTVPVGLLPSGTTIRTLFPVDSTTGPDSLYILYLYDMDNNQPPTTNTAVMLSGSGQVSVASISGFLAAGGELVLITDSTNPNASNPTADLFQTSAAAGGVLTFGGGTNYNTAAHPKFPAGGYGVGPPASTVAKARFLRYFIDNVTDPARPTLMVDRMMAGQAPQPVADDIEDMQLRYGLDTTGTPDGIVDTWIDSVSTAQIAQIRQVRIFLLGRTRTQEKGWTEIRPALGNRAAGTTTDGYKRRILDKVVDVRNSGMP
jgi:type IV pilus assembly protein PilW